MKNKFYQKLNKLRAANDPQATEKFLLDAARENNEYSTEWLAAKGELATFYRARGKFDLAVRAYEEIKYAILKTAGSNTTDYAIAINNLGEAYRIKGDPATALLWFREAKKIFEKLNMSGDYYYATILNNMSLALLDNEDFYGSEQRLQEALNLLELAGYYSRNSVSYTQKAG